MHVSIIRGSRDYNLGSTHWRHFLGDAHQIQHLMGAHHRDRTLHYSLNIFRATFKTNNKVNKIIFRNFQFFSWSSLSVQSLSCVWLCATPWTAARQASLSITNSQSLPKLMSIESVMPSNHLILSHPLLLLPSVFHRIRIFSNESVLRIRWPQYWSFSFNISPSNEDLGWTGWIPLQSKGLSRVFSNSIV